MQQHESAARCSKHSGCTTESAVIKRRWGSTDQVKHGLMYLSFLRCLDHHKPCSLFFFVCFRERAVRHQQRRCLPGSHPSALPLRARLLLLLQRGRILWCRRVLPEQHFTQTLQRVSPLSAHLLAPAEPAGDLPLPRTLTFVCRAPQEPIERNCYSGKALLFLFCFFSHFQSLQASCSLSWC